jgi:cell division protease FtsH
MAKNRILWQLVLFGKKIISLERSKAKLMVETNVKTSFADITAAEETKQKLQQIVDFLKLPDDIQCKGIGLPRGVLIVGPPGQDRALLAQAFAGEAHVPFFSISGPDFIDDSVADSRVRDLFKQVRKHVPCLIFIEDIDVIFSSLDEHAHANDALRKTREQLLFEIDSDAGQKRILVIGSASSVENIDSTLRLRFDRCFRIERTQSGSLVCSCQPD